MLLLPGFAALAPAVDAAGYSIQPIVLREPTAADLPIFIVHGIAPPNEDAEGTAYGWGGFGLARAQQDGKDWKQAISAWHEWGYKGPINIVHYYECDRTTGFSDDDLSRYRIRIVNADDYGVRPTEPPIYLDQRMWLFGGPSPDAQRAFLRSLSNHDSFTTVHYPPEIDSPPPRPGDVTITRYDNGASDLTDHWHTGGSCGRPVRSTHGWDAPIEHLAYHVAWAIFKNTNEGRDCVNVVVHSMGGLIMRYAIGAVERGYREFPPLLCVRNFVTVATPHSGSLWSSLPPREQLNYGGKQAAQMSYGSAFLAKLNSEFKQARNRDGRPLDSTAIASAWDDQVDWRSGAAFDMFRSFDWRTGETLRADRRYGGAAFDHRIVYYPATFESAPLTPYTLASEPESVRGSASQGGKIMQGNFAAASSIKGARDPTSPQDSLKIDHGAYRYRTKTEREAPVVHFDKELGRWIDFRGPATERKDECAEMRPATLESPQAYCLRNHRWYDSSTGFWPMREAFHAMLSDNWGCGTRDRPWLVGPDEAIDGFFLSTNRECSYAIYVPEGATTVNARIVGMETAASAPSTLRLELTAADAPGPEDFCSEGRMTCTPHGVGPSSTPCAEDGKRPVCAVDALSRSGRYWIATVRRVDGDVRLYHKFTLQATYDYQDDCGRKGDAGSDTNRSAYIDLAIHAGGICDGQLAGIHDTEDWYLFDAGAYDARLALSLRVASLRTDSQSQSRGAQICVFSLTDPSIARDCANAKVGSVETLSIQATQEDRRFFLRVLGLGDASKPVAYSWMVIKEIGPQRPRLRDVDCGLRYTSGETVTCTFRAVDADSDGVAYSVVWGDAQNVRVPTGDRRVRPYDLQSVTTRFFSQPSEFERLHACGKSGVSSLCRKSYTIEVRAADESSGLGEAEPTTRTITVVPNYPPVAHAPRCASILDEVRCSIGSTDDSGGVFYTIDWGDGTPPQRHPETGYTPPGAAIVSHAFARVGSYGVTVNVTDNGDSFRPERGYSSAGSVSENVRALVRAQGARRCSFDVWFCGHSEPTPDGRGGFRHQTWSQGSPPKRDDRHGARPEVIGLEWAPERPRDGELVTFVARVQNLGDATAKDILFRADGPEGLSFATTIARDLKPGEVEVVEFDWVATAGFHVARALATFESASPYMAPMTVEPPTEVRSREIHVIGGSTVNAQEGALVVAHAGSIVEARAGSEIVALAGSLIKAYEGSVVSAFETAKITAYRGATVIAFDAAAVEAPEAANVTLHNAATVIAHQSAIVNAYDASRVEAHRGAEVHAFDAARIEAHEGAIVNAYNASAVLAHEAARVEAHDSAHVEAHKASVVNAYDAATVVAYSGSIVDAYGASTVTAFEGTVVRLHEASKLKAERATEIVAHAGTTVEARNATLVTAYESSRIAASGATRVEAFTGADVLAYAGATVVAHKGASVTAYRSSNITAFRGSRILAYEGAVVHAYEGAAVLAFRAAQIRAYGGSEVTAVQGALVRAFEASNIKAFDGAVVAAYKGSSVIAHRASNVSAYAGANVTAYSASVVMAYAGSNVAAFEAAEVKAWQGAEVLAYRASTIEAYQGSTVRAYAGSTIMAHEGAQIHPHEGAKIEWYEAKPIDRYKAREIEPYKG